MEHQAQFGSVTTAMMRPEDLFPVPPPLLNCRAGPSASARRGWERPTPTTAGLWESMVRKPFVLPSSATRGDAIWGIPV